MIIITPVSAQSDDETYRSLVQRVKGGDLTVDFRALRFACMKSDLCQPRASAEQLMALNRAESTGQYQTVAEICEQFIDQGFVNGEAHAVIAMAYLKLNQPEKAEFHFEITKALVLSIEHSGDGKTEQTAFEVIYDREEWYVLTALGLPYHGDGVASRQIEDGGHHYTKFEIWSPKLQRVVVVFFRTDAFSDKSIGR